MARHYDTPCTLRFRARSAGTAVELCKAAADHLEETFNDDGSYLGLIVGPAAPDPAREALAELVEAATHAGADLRAALAKARAVLKQGEPVGPNPTEVY